MRVLLIQRVFFPGELQRVWIHQGGLGHCANAKPGCVWQLRRGPERWSAW